LHLKFSTLIYTGRGLNAIQSVHYTNSISLHGITRLGFLILGQILCCSSSRPCALPTVLHAATAAPHRRSNCGVGVGGIFGSCGHTYCRLMYPVLPCASSFLLIYTGRGLNAIQSVHYTNSVSAWCHEFSVSDPRSNLPLFHTIGI
jgi:hypothetical protein